MDKPAVGSICIHRAVFCLFALQTSEYNILSGTGNQMPPSLLRFALRRKMDCSFHVVHLTDILVGGDGGHGPEPDIDYRASWRDIQSCLLSPFLSPFSAFLAAQQKRRGV